jgi:chromatin remodeling complex protein RSC6
MATKKSTAKKSSAKKSSAKKSSAKKGGAKKATKKAAPKKKAAAKKATAKKATKKAAPKKKAAKRTPNPSFMKPVQPDAMLAMVVGEKPLPRTELTSKLWDYIRKNGLQDQQERRMINADDKLKPVFGGKSRVSMFDMTKLVNQHIKK